MYPWNEWCFSESEIVDPTTAVGLFQGLSKGSRRLQGGESPQKSKRYSTGANCIPPAVQSPLAVDGLAQPLDKFLDSPGSHGQIVALKNAVDVGALIGDGVNPLKVHNGPAQERASILCSLSAVHEENRSTWGALQQNVQIPGHCFRFAALHRHRVKNNQPLLCHLGRKRRLKAHSPHTLLEFVCMGSRLRTMDGPSASPQGRADGSCTGVSSLLLGMWFSPSTSDFSPAFGRMGALLPLCKLPANNPLKDIAADLLPEYVCREFDFTHLLAHEV
mmetsp:Transcript_29291/g.82630  ORF Transcript_29291/g.82630 Transcript_29291/m.82630 type:complete len:275 (+) Transcript_29291:1140-1964(+)